jgi:hypothetical protein
MRRSMAPRRPVLFEEQWPLALVTGLLLLGGVGAAVWAVVG